MKMNIKSLFAASLVVLTVGCTDLDVPVDSQYTSYPSNSEAIESKMAGIYFTMRDCFGRRYMESQALSSDEFTALSFGGGWLDNHAYANTSFHSWNAECACIDWMHVLGEGVVTANEVINSDAEEKYIASARAIRAYFTYLEMDSFGDCPINDQTYAEEQGFDVSDRQPRADVARWIEKELLAVADLLPEETTGENYGKPNKYMAYGLLARLYINWPVYTAASVDQYDAASYAKEKLNDCVAACDKIINSGKFELGPVPYRFKFGPNNSELVDSGQIKDFIYAMPYHTLNAPGMQYGRSHSYKDGKSMSPSYYGMNLSQSCGAYITVTPECSKRMLALSGDERQTMILNGQVYVYDPETLLPTDQMALDRNGNPLVLTQEITLTRAADELGVEDNLEGWRQGNRSIKWFVLDSDFKNGRNQSNDLPIIRYADILMMKAEAITRGATATGGQTAQSLFNQIRSYVSAPTIDHNPSLDEIYEERGREFFDENLRRIDMIRFGHFEDEYCFHKQGFGFSNFDPRHRIFPIHKNDLDSNPTWVQNPGY